MESYVGKKDKENLQSRYELLYSQFCDLMENNPASFFETDKGAVALLNELEQLERSLCSKVDRPKAPKKRLSARQLLAFKKREDNFFQKYYDALELEQLGNKDSWIQDKSDYDIIDGGWFPEYYYDPDNAYCLCHDNEETQLNDYGFHE